MTLLRPRWVAGHLVVLVLSASFIALGFWQLARNNHKHALVREARAAYAAPAPDISSDAHISSGDRVQASGRYAPAHQVLLRNQVRNGHDGVDVLTPLVIADGSTVIVNRGWIPAAGNQAAASDLVTESGPVVVRGLARTSSALSAQDTVTDAGHILSLPRVDLNRIGREVGTAVRPTWIEAQAQDPAPAPGAPQLPEPPPPDQVNHMQYAIQWFSFALIGIIGWPVALVAFSRRRGGFTTTS